MTAPVVSGSRRVRASERAISAAIRAMQNAGLPVGKLLITGSQVEIYCGGVEATAAEKEDEGLGKW